MYFLCGRFQWRKFPFLLTLLIRCTLRSSLLVKCHPNTLFLSTQRYSKDLTFEQRLCKRGYPTALNHKILTEIEFSDRAEAPCNKTKKAKEILPFVTTNLQPVPPFVRPFNQPEGTFPHTRQRKCDFEFILIFSPVSNIKISLSKQKSIHLPLQMSYKFSVQLIWESQVILAKSNLTPGNFTTFFLKRDNEK